MPILLIFFLGSQMAYGQVKGKYTAYQNIPEITRVSELAALPAGQIVMLKGRIAKESCQSTSLAACGSDQNLLIFRERPAGDREVRFREEFGQFFPEFIITLADGSVAIRPNLTQEPIIQHELHGVSDGDREQTGFRVGDLVTVQGQWQPGEALTLIEVTGITGADKTGLMLEWQAAFQKVTWARNGLGLLTLASLILLIVQLRRTKVDEKPDQDQEEEWPPQKTKTAPIA
jgi:hypothetical protein